MKEVLKYDIMKREMEVELHVFLIRALNGGEWSASHSGHFNQHIWSAENRFVRGGDEVDNFSCRESKPGRSIQ
jgi:hypothetical protein